jgi:hypothetical protein
MNMHLKLKTSLLLAGLLALPLAHATTMAEADYKVAKNRIGTDYTAAKAACASLAANAKDICIEEAKAKESVAYAELESSYTGKPADQNKVLVAKAEASYAVAKEKCDDLSGNAKDVCVQQAKAAETKALADAKMGKEIGAARKDAAEDKRDADYKVAAEKCDALAGDAKAACVVTARAKFGKS